MGLNQQTTGSNGTALHSPGPGTSSHSAGLGFLCCRTIPVGMLVAGDIVRHGSPTVCVDALRTLLDSTCMPKAKSEPPNSWKIIPGLPEKTVSGPEVIEVDLDLLAPHFFDKRMKSSGTIGSLMSGSISNATHRKKYQQAASQDPPIGPMGL